MSMNLARMQRALHKCVPHLRKSLRSAHHCVKISDCLLFKDEDFTSIGTPSSSKPRLYGRQVPCSLAPHSFYGVAWNRPTKNWFSNYCVKCNHWRCRSYLRSFPSAFWINDRALWANVRSLKIRIFLVFSWFSWRLFLIFLVDKLFYLYQDLVTC